jgi:hypothetical protein
LVPCGALFCLEPLLVKVIRLFLPKVAGNLWAFTLSAGYVLKSIVLRLTDFVPSLFSLIGVRLPSPDSDSLGILYVLNRFTVVAKPFLAFFSRFARLGDTLALSAFRSYYLNIEVKALRAPIGSI